MEQLDPKKTQDALRKCFVEIMDCLKFALASEKRQVKASLEKCYKKVIGKSLK